MKTFKKLLSLIFAALMCFSLTSCSTESSADLTKTDMTEFHTYLAESEKDVLKYLGVKRSDIKSRVKAEDGIDITLKEPFEYNEEKAEVMLSFYKGHLVFVRYTFPITEAGGAGSQAAFDYAMEMKEKFDGIYETNDAKPKDNNLTGLTQELFDSWDSSVPSPRKANEWLIEDRNGIREKIAWDERFTDLLISVALSKNPKATEVTVGILAGKATN